MSEESELSEPTGSTTNKPNIDPKKVRYCYLRDPRDYNRVLTIARVLDGDFVHYECAVNNIEYISAYEDEKKHLDTKKSDVFSRHLGRSIALGRLKANPITISVSGTDRAIEKVVEAIATEDLDDLPSAVQRRRQICKRIARSHLPSFQKFSQLKAGV